MKNANVIPVGTIIVITSGSFSAYGIDGFFKVLKEIDREKLTKQFLSHRKFTSESESDRVDRFIAWMIKEEFIDPADDLCAAWYIPDPSLV